MDSSFSLLSRGDRGIGLESHENPYEKPGVNITDATNIPFISPYTVCAGVSIFSTEVNWKHLVSTVIKFYNTHNS